LNANVKHEIEERFAHNFPRAVPGNLIRHLYSNLPNSGISQDDEISAWDENWKDNGYYLKFDQTPIIQKAIQEYGKKNCEHCAPGEKNPNH